MAQKLDEILELDQDTPTLDALAPSTHPPIVLPENAFPADPRNPPVLVFAPAPTIPAAPFPADRPLPAVSEDLPAPPTRPKGRFRVGWYEAAIIALMLGCAALGVYRLLWAIQI